MEEAAADSVESLTDGVIRRLVAAVDQERRRRVRERERNLFA